MLAVRITDAETAEVTFGVAQVLHPACGNTAVLARMITVLNGVTEVRASHQVQCEACHRAYPAPDETFPSLAAALGDPPPGSPITAEAMAAEIIEDIAISRRDSD